MNSKKAISPIVAIGLLLVVTVAAFVGFQTWFQGFQSGTQTDIVTQADSGAPFSLLAISGGADQVFVKNLGSTALNVTQIVIGGSQCNITQNNQGWSSISASTTGNISLGTCTITAGATVDVIVSTDHGAVTTTMVVSE